MIGRTISHYHILGELGAGGMGVVYKAEDIRLKRIVALKFLPRDALADPAAKSRLLHEAQAAAALDHPNICTIHEIEEAGEHTFIVMTIVEGSSIKQMIAAGPVALEAALDIARQTAEGLAAAHSKGIFHRDIKPANLMLSRSGQVKIMDFGLARAAGQTRLTKSGAAMGTAAYMSPEQARGATVDQRTDVWSLGVTLFEMITGRLPFRGEHEQAVLYSLLNEEPEPLTALRTDVPMELERLVNKAMAKRPEDRYQHLDDLLVDLKAVERKLAAPAGSVTAGSTVRVAQKNRKRSGVMAAAVVLIAAAAALTLVLWHGGERRWDRSARGGEGGKIQSLAVLPFDNLMNDPEQEYFVDGMHDALITGLSKLGSLRVISRTSVMRYRDTEKPIPEIARELDVDVLIEGSVLRVGNEVRITVQLIDGANDEHLWAHGYDRDLRNVLSLLNEVAGAVAVEVDATLTPRQEDRLARARSVDPDAYEALLRGMQLFNTFKLMSVRESIAFFEKAIAIDPKLAEAHAGLAGAYVVWAVLGDLPAEHIPKAREAARKALEIDDGLADAHTAAGYVSLYFDRDWQAGAEAFRKALEIDPNNSLARHGYADYLVVQGRLDESVEQVLLGRKSNPLSPIANFVVVGHLYIARRYGEAVAEAKRLLAIDPKYPGASMFMREAYWQMGKLEESVEMLRETGWGRDPQFREAMDLGYAAGGPPGVMLALAELLETKSRSEHVDPQTIALHYAWAGRSESAMDWMEKAAEGRSLLFVHALLDPAFDSIRDTPRFKQLRRRLNLPE